MNLAFRISYLAAVIIAVSIQAAGLYAASELTVNYTDTLTDGAVIACCSDAASKRLIALMIKGQPSRSAMQKKLKRVTAQIQTLKTSSRSATGAKKNRLRNRLASKKTLKAGITSFRRSCVNSQPIPTPRPGLIADHTAVSAFNDIPGAVFETVRQHFKVFYGHTSHGSQAVTGLKILERRGAAPAFDSIQEYGGDLGHTGDLSWVSVTRNWLNAHPNYNVVVWSWCGGVSDNTVAGINSYLEAMARLEEQYPNVIFVYMTGHLDGSGENGRLRTRNRQIRDYCRSRGRVLFDFEDIESWDPSENYYANDSDACEWCSAWCSTHSCPSCGALGGCAHSHCFNCYQKGKAWWWMMARLSGWEG